MRTSSYFVLTALFLILIISKGNSQIVLTGSAYTQDFNTLANSGTSSSVPTGWLFLETGTSANTTYTAGTGSGTAGDTYSFGATASNDRAFGGLQSGSLIPTIGASFTNSTGATVTSLTISYTGEQWRLGATSRVDRIDFQYSLNATSLTTGIWTDVDNLDFTAPNTGPTLGALDGNAVANKTSVSFTINGLSIANGATFFIRWNDFNAAGSDDGLAIDDFSISTSNIVTTKVDVTAGANASEPSTSGTFNITLSSPAPAEGVTVTYNLSGTATLNTDYTDPQNGSVIIAEGNTTATLTLNVTDDPDPEPTETITITLTGATSPYTINTSTATINLTSDDIAPVSLSGIYSQDFNTLVNTGTGSLFALPQGWMFSETGTGANTVYTANNGGSTSGDTYSFGTGTNTDRALGTLQTNAFVSTIGSSFINNTGSTISAVAITYTGEQWRLGSTGRNDFLNFQYSTDATNLTTGTWVNVQQLDFTSPISTGSVGALDGNASANRTIISFALTGLSIPNGATFFIRWFDPNVTGADDGLAVDDFSIEPNPADPYPPVVTSLFPANGATNVSTNLTASITFDETIQKGTGNVIIKKVSDNSIVQTIDVNDAAIIVSTTKVLFNLSDLGVNTDYYIEVDNGAFKDLANNIFAGINGNSTWVFTTGTIFYSADFQTCSSSLSDGCTQYSEVGPITWGCTAFGIDAAHTPTGSAANGVQINGFSGGTNVPNVDWLISPSVNLTGTTYPLLSFWSRTAFNGLPLQLKISTDYISGDPMLATWTDINGKFPSQTSNIWTLSSNINLSSFKQSNVHFAFVYTSSNEDGARWTLDDISIDNSPTPPPPSLTVSTNDIQFSYTASGSTTDKTFTFTGNDLTNDVTLNSTGAFLLSKDGSSFTSSLTYSVDEANNLTKTVHARFAPSQNNQNFTGTLTVSTSDISANINLKGTSIDPETTLEVVNWNMEWFGSTTLGPTDDDQQEQNAEIILKNIGADVFGLVEVVDETRLARIVSHMPGYSYVICNYGSHVNPFEPGASPLSEAQKEAFVYKTSLFNNISTTPLVTDGVNNAEDLSNPAYNYFASGRYPYMMKADVTLNGVTKTIRFVLLHAKANTSPTVTSYNRRKAGADTLKFTLNNLYPNDNILMLGDFNDDLDSTITDGINPRISSYYAFTNDTVTTFSSPTLALSLAGKKSTVSYNDVIDHVMLSNELLPYYMPATANVLTDAASLVSNYGTTTTDHYPVFTRYMFCKLTCPENIVVSNDAGQCGAVVNFDIGSTMTCGTVTAAPASGSFFPIGITTVHVTASTGDTCFFTVTVKDNENPTINCPGSQTRNTNANQCGYTTVGTEFEATANDNCSGIVITNNYNNSNTLAGAIFNKGQTTVIWTATDAVGNTATCSFQITIEDHQAPVIAAPDNVTVNTDNGVCYATNVSLGTAITSDNCLGEIATNNAPPQFAKGTTIVLWTVTDASGNTGTATQTVTVNDTEKPAISSCPVVPVLCHNISGTYTIPAITATDNCGAITYSYEIAGATNRLGNTNNASGAFNVGTNTITWTVKDGSNNSSTCQTSVIVNPPVTASVADVYAVNPGGAINTIYIGYGPTSLTLNAAVSGGTSPYSYKWTIGSSAGPALNSSSSFTVSPTTTTTYYFNAKDIYGCSAPLATKTVNVVDVGCGTKMDKVTVCQFSKGKYSTNCLATKDVSSALSNGSYLGACANAAIVTKANTQAISEPSEILLAITAMPNPSANYFIINIKGGNALEKMKLRVTDVLGRSIEQKDNIQTNSTLKIGNNYFPGVYIVEVIQGVNRKQIKLIKTDNE